MAYIRFGGSAITQAYIGSAVVKAIYLGSTLVYQQGSSSSSGSSSGSGSGNGSGSAYSMRNIDELMDMINE